jgi:hypothetical protein
MLWLSRRRDFIQKDLVEFAKANPSIVMEARIRGNEHPYIRGEYSMLRDSLLDYALKAPLSVQLTVHCATGTYKDVLYVCLPQ